MISELREKVNDAKSKRDFISTQLKDFKQNQIEQTAEAEVLNLTHNVLEISADLLHKDIRTKIESLVTEGLRQVFERDDYRFEFEMEVKRNNMTAIPMLYCDMNGEEICTRIKDGQGGGISDIVAFLLNIVFLMLHRPKLANVFIGDENFKHVSKEYLSNTAELLTWLNSLLGMQFIIITHKEEFLDVADRVFEVDQKDGITFLNN